MSRIPGLDGLRGVAILLVFWFHSFFFFMIEGPLDYWLKRLAHAGWVGVDLFFVLSGFLITGLLEEARRGGDSFGRAYGRFLLRRALRIFPLYYFSLVVALVALPLALDLTKVKGFALIAENQAWLWAYLTNWFYPKVGGFPEFHYLGHVWTLAIEEQFYVVWPWIVLLGSRRVQVASCVAAIVVATLTRIATLRSGMNWELVYTHTLMRCDALAYGCLARIALPAVVASARAARANLGAMGIAAAAVVTLFFTEPGFYARPMVLMAGLPALGILFASLILALASGGLPRVRRVLDWRALRFLGKYSYAMYIFHWPVILVLVQDLWLYTRLRLMMPNLAAQAGTILVAGAATVAVSLLSWVLIEGPGRKLKERLP